MCPTHAFQPSRITTSSISGKEFHWNIHADSPGLHMCSSKGRFVNGEVLAVDLGCDREGGTCM